MHALFQVETQGRGGNSRAKDDGANTTPFVREVKVLMTGRGATQVGYLSFNPEKGIALVKEVLDIVI